MKLNRPFALLLAFGLQVMPMLRAVLPVQTQGFAPSAWAMVLKLATGTVALLGSHHAVSGASTAIVKPYTVNATNLVPYKRTLACDTHAAHSWSASSGVLRAATYSLGFGLFLTNATGKIGGIPNQTGTTNIAITGWEDSGNAGRKTTSTFTITVFAGNGPPVISTQPQSIGVVLSNNALFSVTAQGTQPFQYQWRFEGVNLPDATNATLTVSNVQAADAGLYSVRVSNSLGATNSSNAVLTVLFRPVITSHPPSVQVLTLGDTLTLSVTASGTLPMGFRWRRGSVVLTNFVLNSNTSVFTIPNVQTNHAATYSVVVTNAASTGGVLSSNTVVTVSLGPPPTLVLVPASDGRAIITWAPATPNFVLQEALSLSSSVWTNSPSGATNPISVPATGPAKFYRLRQP